MRPYPWTHVRTPSHLGHMDRVAATMPSQAHAGAAQEAPDIGQWEGQDTPLIRPSSCNVKGGIPSSRRYLPTYLALVLPSEVEYKSISRKSSFHMPPIKTYRADEYLKQCIRLITVPKALQCVANVREPKRSEKPATFLTQCRA